MSAILDPFRANLYLEDVQPQTPFAYVDFPSGGAGELQDVSVSQRVDVANSAGFASFAERLLTNRTLRVAVEGDTRVKVKGIARSYPVTFKKVLDIDGRLGALGLCSQAL